MVMQDRIGQTIVVFISRRDDLDEAGYAQASGEMAALAARQPGYRGMESVRGADGAGITISYWVDDDAAIAWRDHADHCRIRDQGRARWYNSYEVVVAIAERAYKWKRD